MSFIQTGNELIAAKADCDHGEWKQLVGRYGYKGLLPFKETQARYLIHIASDPRIARHAALLPPDSTSLYKLTRLSIPRFDELLEGGVINPSMKRNEASAETRKEKKEEDERRILSLTPVIGKHKTLIIDPPWDYEWLSLAGRAAPGYATMGHEELLGLDVEAWADDNCHLYLWTTNNFITRAVELMARWGFQHKTVLTWVKPRWGLGSYFRNSTEQVLFGVRGELRTRADNIATHFEAPTTEHSVKPDIFYDIVRRASYPPYGEIFQREARPDFANLFKQEDAA
jgi:N6-adenosine-specific RNA methylase IME4